jgi:hypothetical protein
VSFVCRNDDITECMCAFKPIPAHVREYMSLNYNDCLCSKCIENLIENLNENNKNLENEKN